MWLAAVVLTCGGDVLFVFQEYDTCHLLKTYNGPPVEILVDQVGHEHRRGGGRGTKLTTKCAVDAEGSCRAPSVVVVIVVSRPPPTSPSLSLVR